jgi:hypothetical protein
VHAVFCDLIGRPGDGTRTGGGGGGGGGDGDGDDDERLPGETDSVGADVENRPDADTFSALVVAFGRLSEMRKVCHCFS